MFEGRDGPAKLFFRAAKEVKTIRLQVKTGGHIAMGGGGRTESKREHQVESVSRAGYPSIW